MKLAILVTHPVQYFAPVFRALAQQSLLELKVFFGCNHGLTPQVDPNFGVTFKWDCEPTAGYEHEFISTAPLKVLSGLSGVQLAHQAFSRVNVFQPDAVLIFAYTPTFITASTFLLRMAGHRLMLRAETTDEALQRSTLKDSVRKVFLTNYYQQFSHFFPIGTNSLQHYRRMGVSDQAMTVVPYAIDVDFFQKQVDHWLPQRETLRAKMGIKPTDQVLMYCGKMFEPKNPLLIPQALERLSTEQKEKLWFLAVGDGVLRAAFEAGCKAQLGKRAVFVGFRNQSELGRYYAMADTLVLPSQSGETWGLVVNEALQFGLQVIASDKVGSSRDLIQDLDTGFVFASQDASNLSKAVTQILSANQQGQRLPKTPHPQQLALAINSVI